MINIVACFFDFIMHPCRSSLCLEREGNGDKNCSASDFNDLVGRSITNQVYGIPHELDLIEKMWTETVRNRNNHLLGSTEELILLGQRSGER